MMLEIRNAAIAHPKEGRTDTRLVVLSHDRYFYPGERCMQPSDLLFAWYFDLIARVIVHDQSSRHNAPEQKVQGVAQWKKLLVPPHVGAPVAIGQDQALSLIHISEPTRPRLI
eukprot:1014928-Amphidinium_carterae.1